MAGEIKAYRDIMIRTIAHIHNDFTAKFGIPRQSGLTSAESVIVFEPEYRDINAFRGLEEYSYIWLLWEFSKLPAGNGADNNSTWSPMVHPPRLGGNKRMGVFATRSPVRPSPIGLSSVKLLEIETDKRYGPVLRVQGTDLLDGTPIYDIKPYITYTDSHPDAVCGFADRVSGYSLEVVFPDELMERLPVRLRQAVTELLKQDPRPQYQNDETRRYGMEYGGYDIRFHVREGVLTVCEVVKLE